MKSKIFSSILLTVSMATFAIAAPLATLLVTSKKIRENNQKIHEKNKKTELNIDNNKKTELNIDNNKKTELNNKNISTKNDEIIDKTSTSQNPIEEKKIVEDPDFPTHLKIAMWNVLNLYPNSKETKLEALAKIIIHENLSLVGLTEVQGEKKRNTIDPNEIDLKAKKSTENLINKLNSIDTVKDWDYVISPKLAAPGKDSQMESVAIIYKNKYLKPIPFVGYENLDHKLLGAKYHNTPWQSRLKVSNEKSQYIREPFGAKFQVKNKHQNDFTIVVGHFDPPGSKDKRGEKNAGSGFAGQGNFEIEEAFQTPEVMQWFDSIDGKNDDLFFMGDTNIKLKPGLKAFERLEKTGYKNLIPISEGGTTLNGSSTNFTENPYDRIFYKGNIPYTKVGKFKELAQINESGILGNLEIKSIRDDISDHTLVYVELKVDEKDVDDDTAQPIVIPKNDEIKPDVKQDQPKNTKEKTKTNKNNINLFQNEAKLTNEQLLEFVTEESLNKIKNINSRQIESILNTLKNSPKKIISNWDDVKEKNVVGGKTIEKLNNAFPFNELAEKIQNKKTKKETSINDNENITPQDNGEKNIKPQKDGNQNTTPKENGETTDNTKDAISNQDEEILPKISEVEKTDIHEIKSNAKQDQPKEKTKKTKGKKKKKKKSKKSQKTKKETSINDNENLPPQEDGDENITPQDNGKTTDNTKDAISNQDEEILPKISEVEKNDISQKESEKKKITLSMLLESTITKETLLNAGITDRYSKPLLEYLKKNPDNEFKGWKPLKDAIKGVGKATLKKLEEHFPEDQLFGNN
ncbi:endonuclease/exonuclease/phosphatase family protein [Mesomycoplasma neurolyticum]|nr:endonuclease/exonuclease/phosphatase family protein [Mesomycoplasma neurolyticum]